MDREAWERIERAFEQVVDLPADERAEALDAACGTDERLRARVERLLRDDARPPAGPLDLGGVPRSSGVTR